VEEKVGSRPQEAFQAELRKSTPVSLEMVVIDRLNFSESGMTGARLWKNEGGRMSKTHLILITESR
jgi:hypothetical protein